LAETGAIRFVLPANMLDGIQSAQSHQQSAAHQQLADTGVMGSYRGQQVAVVDLQSLIADSAEEMSFFKSEKMEKKSLKERRGQSSESKLERLKQLAALLVKKIPDLGDKPRMDHYVERLLAFKERSMQLLREETARSFPDVSQQYAALTYAAEALGMEESEEAQALAAEVRSLAAAIMEESRPEVVAGLNISAEAARFEEAGLDSIQGLRDFYRTSVVGYENSLAAFDGVMEKYGAAKFDQGLQFLIESIGRERGLSETSAPIEELEASVNDLYFVQFIGNSDARMQAILERVDVNFT